MRHLRRRNEGLMDTGPLVIVPGSNPVLSYVARQLGALADVRVLSSANDVLWLARQTPPRIVLADLQLNDMSGIELAEILPNLAPDARIVICGADRAAAGAVQTLGAEYVLLDGTAGASVAEVYRALNMPPPAVLPGTDELRNAPPVPTEAPATTRPAAPPATTPTAPATTPTPEAQAASRPAPTTSPAARPVPSPASPPARPAPSPSPANGGFSGDGSFVIQPQQAQVLSKLLGTIGTEVGAECVLLIDAAGMVLMQTGSDANVALPMVGPLLATSFSSTGQLARMLQEPSANATYIHEGERYDIYAFNISYRVSLVILFDRKINPGKVGTVWVYSKRALRQIQQILKL
jgi:ActR/RegA family two-component response regulator